MEGAGTGNSSGMGCRRSHPAGRAGEGSESLPAFPARVGPPQPPGISLVALRAPKTISSHEKTPLFPKSYPLA